MTDPLSIMYLAIIGFTVPLIAYLLPQDPAVVRLVDGIHRRRHHRRLRRWVARNSAVKNEGLSR
jgi:hypothetical protein